MGKGSYEVESRRLAKLRRGYRDAQVALARPSVIPTLTLGTAGLATSQIPGAVLYPPLKPDNTPSQYMRLLGGYDVAFGTSGNDVNQVQARSATGSTNLAMPYSATFGLSGVDRFEIRFKYGAFGSYRLRIDGRWVTERDCIPPGSPVSGSIYGILVSGLDTGPHIYQIDCGNFLFGGIYVTPAAAVWKPPAPQRRAVLLSDSTGRGNGGPSVDSAGAGTGDGSTSIDTWWMRTCDLLGWDESFNASISGTGILNPGNTAAFPTRLTPDVSSVNADVIVISGSRNDSAVSAFTPASLADEQTAATALYTRAKAENPQALIIAIGSWTARNRTSDYTDVNTGIRQAARACGLPFIDMYAGQVIAGDGRVLIDGAEWVTGTGKYGSPVGSNRYYYQSFDNAAADGDQVTLLNTGGGVDDNTALGRIDGTDPITYSLAAGRAGTLGIRIASGSTVMAGYNMNQTRVAVRTYMKLPTAVASLVKILHSDGDVTTNFHRAHVTAAQKLDVQIGSGAIVTSTTTLPTNALFRLEFLLTVNGSTATLTAKIFLTVESATPTETITTSGSFADTLIGNTRLGAGGAAPADLYFDAWEFNNVDYPGPLTSAAHIKPGNADWLMASDGLHPHLDGHAFWARKANAAIRAILDDLSPAALA